MSTDISATATGFRELSGHEIETVNGGVIPLAVAAYYSAGFVTGVVGGYMFGRDLWAEEDKE